MANSIKNDLIASGFVPNVEKSQWEPVQKIEFLGACLDSKDFTISIPKKRIDKAVNTMLEIENSIRQHRRVHVKKVASFVGQVISMSIVVGNLCQFMTRYLSIDISLAPNWSYFIKLSTQSLEQLSFWKKSLTEINCRHLNHNPSYTKIIYTDASTIGYSGYEVNTPNGMAHGAWGIEEAVKSSTWRELMAVFKVLKALSIVLASNRVKWFTDNQGVCSIIEKGSMKTELQDLAFKIHSFCVKYSIIVDIQWIPREKNQIADYLSKIIERDDWGLSPFIINLIIDKWGTIDIDWFASPHNAKLPVFYSRFWNEFCAGVDAFSANWNEKFGLFVPPVTLLTRVLSKMLKENARGIIVIPSAIQETLEPETETEEEDEEEEEEENSKSANWSEAEQLLASAEHSKGACSSPLRRQGTSDRGL
ncbi:uncharacterized protein [Palaemon carinicauda]|uniref:uncharacterized protein n=1 Tax=Palaemon carinicauda TaxID=392227 RepID=UPI0035B5C333